MKNLKDKTKCDGTMTEAQYWGRIRSVLRNGSLRWVPLQKVLMQNRRPYNGPNPRQQWEYQCSSCKKWFPRKLVERDHAEGCGPLNEATAGEFIVRMYCDTKDLRLLCKDCHSVVSYAANMNVSFEEAAVNKKVINILKDKKSCVNLLSSLGYSKEDASNEGKRRDLLLKLAKEGRLP